MHFCETAYWSTISAYVMKFAEAIHTKVVPITWLNITTDMPISGLISKTVVSIYNATGIGYTQIQTIRHNPRGLYSSKCCDVTALVAIGNYQNNMASL